MAVSLVTACPSGIPRTMSDKALSRLPELLPANLSETQKKLYDQILAGAKDSSGKPLKTRVNEATGGLLGPFNAFLRPDAHGHGP
eukprot:s4399_g5.t1